jgi:hypothetical protein
MPVSQGKHGSGGAGGGLQQTFRKSRYRAVMNSNTITGTTNTNSMQTMSPPNNPKQMHSINASVGAPPDSARLFDH